MKWESFGQLGAVLVTSAATLGCASSDTKGGGATDTTPPATNVVTTENFGMTHTGDGTFYAFDDGSGACLFTTRPRTFTSQRSTSAIGPTAPGAARVQT